MCRARAGAQSRAEDPNYDPDAEARAHAQNSSGPHAAVREEIGETRETSNEPAEGDADEPYLEGDALRLQVNDLVLHSWPPPPVVTFVLGAYYPFQLLGLGIGVTGYAGELVRLSGFASAGMNIAGDPRGSDLAFGGVMEASVGFRVLAGDGHIGTNVVGFQRLKRGEDQPATHHLFNARLPATHALLLEVGVLAGGIPRVRCTENCEQDDATLKSYAAVNPLLVYPEAGLRYVFFSSARSRKQPNMNRRWDVEVFFHAVLRPLGDTGIRALTLSGDRIQKSALGARGGFAVPLCGYHCMTLNVMAGYLPAPDTATFTVGAEY